MKKFGLRFTGRRKCYFFNSCLFPFYKFQMTIVKNLIMNLEDSHEVLLRHKYFWSIYFWQWNGGPFIFLKNLHGNAFCFFIFSNETNMRISLLMLHWKCTTVYYANLNSSFINKSFLNYGPLNMLFRFFFDFLFKFILTRLTEKQNLKKRPV